MAVLKRGGRVKKPLAECDPAFSHSDFGSDGEQFEVSFIRKDDDGKFHSFHVVLTKPEALQFAAFIAAQAAKEFYPKGANLPGNHLRGLAEYVERKGFK